MHLHGLHIWIDIIHVLDTQTRTQLTVNLQTSTPHMRQCTTFKPERGTGEEDVWTDLHAARVQLTTVPRSVRHLSAREFVKCLVPY